jgi:Tol biopolymer transport system component
MRLEDRLAASLRERARSLEPSEQAWEGINRRLDRRPIGGRRGRALTAAAVALVLSAAAVAVSIRAFRDVRPAQPGTVSQPERLSFIRATGGGSLGVDNTDVFTIHPDGTGEANLTNTGDSVEQEAVWTADGSMLATVQRSLTPGANGTFVQSEALTVMNADGKGVRHVSTCEGDCLPGLYSPVWSPDGSRIAVVQDLPVGSAVVVVEANGVGQHALCNGTDCPAIQSEPAWSPDGSLIAFSQAHAEPRIGMPSGSLFVANSTGGNPSRVTGEDCGGLPCPYDFGPGWSPDGSLIAFGRSTGRLNESSSQIAVVAPDGNGLDVLFSCDLPDCYGVSAPVWSPDGSGLAFLIRLANASELRVVTLDGSVRTVTRTCGPGSCGSYGPVWSPDGSQLAYLSGGAIQSAYVVDAAGGDPRLLAQDVEGSLSWVRATPGWRPGHEDGGTSSAPPSSTEPPSAPLVPGQLLFSSDAGSPDEPAVDLYTIRTDGSDLSAPLTTNPDFDGEPAWSPDGTAIAYRTSGGEIRVMNADGTENRRIGDGFHPVWSPDGTELAFYADGGQGGRPAIFVMESDGTRVRKISESAGGDRDPAWSPDGTVIAFTRDDDAGRSGLYLMAPDGSEVRRLTDLPGSVYQPAWSPDGSMIAFIWYASGGNDVYVIGTDGQGLRRVTDVPDGEVHSPSWSPDGSNIAFVVMHGGVPPSSEIDVVGVDGSERALVFADRANIYDVAWQPVG